MNVTTKTLLLAVLAVLTLSPASAEDGSDGTAAEDAGPCQTFEYTLDPPAYHLDLDCIPLPVPGP